VIDRRSPSMSLRGPPLTRLRSLLSVSYPRSMSKLCSCTTLKSVISVEVASQIEGAVLQTARIRGQAELPPRQLARAPLPCRILNLTIRGPRPVMRPEPYRAPSPCQKGLLYLDPSVSLEVVLSLCPRLRRHQAIAAVAARLEMIPMTWTLATSSPKSRHAVCERPWLSLNCPISLRWTLHPRCLAEPQDAASPIHLGKALPLSRLLMLQPRP
jgi:hypothetical protein